MSSLRLAFMGSPDFSVPVLAEILAQGHDVVCVYAQPPRPAGRGQSERKTAVHQFAEAQGIEVRTPKSLRNAEEQAAFAALDLDVAIVVAYGLILPKEILETPNLGCLNVHASLLPRWRGAAPIQRAIMAGDTETGVMIMQMDEGLDTGPVLLGEQVPIAARETYASLHDKLSETGASLMGRALAALSRGSLDATPQVEDGVTYAKKIDKSEARISWSQSAAEIDRQVRGLHPFPGAFFEVPGRKGPVRVKVLNAHVVDDEGAPGEVLSDDLRIACGSGAVHITDVQPAGKGAMKAEAFLRGTPVPRGTILS